MYVPDRNGTWHADLGKAASAGYYGRLGARGGVPLPHPRSSRGRGRRQRGGHSSALTLFSCSRRAALSQTPPNTRPRSHQDTWGSAVGVSPHAHSFPRRRCVCVCVCICAGQPPYQTRSKSAASVVRQPVPPIRDCVRATTRVRVRERGRVWGRVWSRIRVRVRV